MKQSRHLLMEHLMARRVDWSGVFVVCVTPFQKNMAFDEHAMRSLIDTLIAEGVDGLILAGSTGEWFSMSDAERIELFRVAVDQTRGRVKLLAGVASLATATSVALTEAAKQLGMDGVLLLPPPYVLPNEPELMAFFTAVDRVGLPIMLYNNPARTGVNLDAKWLRKLAVLPNVVALKESAKDIGQIADSLREIGEELAVFTGIEPYIVPTLQRGGVGVAAMAPNVLGAQAVEFFRAAARGDWAETMRRQPAIDQLYTRMYGAGINPYVVQKEAMALLGRPGGIPRAPLLPMSDAQRKDLRSLLDRIVQPVA
ncbi:MAG: dihydrodipicolinate synthase family protein [Variovorax sp.]